MRQKKIKKNIFRISTQISRCIAPEMKHKNKYSPNSEKVVYGHNERTHARTRQRTKVSGEWRYQGIDFSNKQCRQSDAHCRQRLRGAMLAWCFFFNKKKYVFNSFVLFVDMAVTRCNVGMVFYFFMFFYLFILFVDMAVARAMLTWCFILFTLFF
jgi:hypothetical protein